LLSSNRTEKIPNERSKLHFLVAWTHAVIIERLRYIPIGWSKTYEFNEADLIFSFDLIDELINN
jgi:dynein heavy chain 1